MSILGVLLLIITFNTAYGEQTYSIREKVYNYFLGAQEPVKDHKIAKRYLPNGLYTLVKGPKQCPGGQIQWVDDDKLTFGPKLFSRKFQITKHNSVKIKKSTNKHQKLCYQKIRNNFSHYKSSLGFGVADTFSAESSIKDSCQSKEHNIFQQLISRISQSGRKITLRLSIVDTKLQAKELTCFYEKIIITKKSISI